MTLKAILDYILKIVSKEPSGSKTGHFLSKLVGGLFPSSECWGFPDSNKQSGILSPK